MVEEVWNGTTQVHLVIIGQITTIVQVGKLDRLGKGLKSCVLLGVGYSVIAFLIAVFFGGPLAQLFVDGGEAEIIANVCAFLLWNTAFYIPLALVNIVRFLIQGMMRPGLRLLRYSCGPSSAGCCR